MQYLTKRLGSSDDPSIKFPLRRLSERSNNALRTPLIGTYRGSVCAREKFGHQQCLQPSPIEVAIVYNLLSRHDVRTLVIACGHSLDEVYV